MITGVVGLDLSVTCTGFCRIDMLEGADMQIKAIKTKARGHNMKRYVHIATEIRRCSMPTDIFFIEDFAYGIRKGSQLATLGELNGVVKYLLWKFTDKHPVPVGIGEWKKFMTGKGNMKKDEFKLAVYKKFGIECKTNDEAAAIGIADLGINAMQIIKELSTRNLMKYEKDKLVEFIKAKDEYLKLPKKKKLLKRK